MRVWYKGCALAFQASEDRFESGHPLHLFLNGLVLIDPKQFHLDIEELVSEKGCEYMEALVFYQERANVEIETIAALVRQNPILKAKLEDESIDKLLVKPSVKKLQF